MFIEKNEHIIIMDQWENCLTRDELVMLRDAGIQTIYLQGSVRWSWIQPEPDVWRWGSLDRRVEAYEAAGIKALVGYFSSCPNWKPNDWYFSRYTTGIHSYTNPETAEDIDDFSARLIERYEGKEVQIVYAMPAAGEFPMAFTPGGSRLPLSDQHLADWIVARQKPLEAQYNEVWTAFHHSCFPTFIGPTLEALREAYQESNHYSLQYTFWQHPDNVQQAVRIVQERLGVQYYVGSEYIQGMSQVAPYAIQRRVRLITSPIHTFQEHRRVQPWMLDTIKRTLRMYEEALQCS